MCAILFQPCSKLCLPFRVTTAAYGENTAFMANLGPLSAPMATWNGHSRSENWFQQVAWMCAIPFQPCSKLCHPFRVTTAAYGQNTAFMAIFGTFWP